jgi:DNA repair protein RadC
MSIYKQYDLPLAGGANDNVIQLSPQVRDQAGREQRIIEQALAILARRHRRGEAFSCPEATISFLRLRLAERPHEVFGCVFLDSEHRVIAVEDMFFGTIDCAFVPTRVILERALHHHAAAVLAYHNHPSGDTTPSRADIRETKHIKKTLALVNIRLLDHFIVSAEAGTSMADRGLL